VVTPNGGELKDKIIRVGHMGNVHYEDYDYLIECMLKLGWE
jgi:aspartate aminotransferase-like enzyme